MHADSARAPGMNVRARCGQDHVTKHVTIRRLKFASFFKCAVNLFRTKSHDLISRTIKYFYGISLLLKKISDESIDESFFKAKPL